MDAKVILPLFQSSRSLLLPTLPTNLVYVQPDRRLRVDPTIQQKRVALGPHVLRELEDKLLTWLVGQRYGKGGAHVGPTVSGVVRLDLNMCEHMSVKLDVWVSDKVQPVET